ncbi:hypothetical protein MSSAC_1276 [Methanosarcina siciliae C2J]|uniref:Uncharacterized protein n=1 Tax=Methanosarcina siciliae C2J TaxID=1434118 RepID=A0A0E3LCP2_9EURY|nr:hypothetical protein [Methanosarcina siciliae]AKB35866.1 hypothetical protein MSSAC_1276 [Methanosarcina siciliae C2J]
MNEHINLIKSGSNESTVGKVLDFYSSIEEMYACWGVSGSPMVESSVKISSGSISYNRYSIPIFVINDAEIWKKKEKLLDLMAAPEKLYDVIKNRHNENVRIIAGINFDLNAKRIYFHEANEGYGYEFDSNGNWDLKTYSLVTPDNYVRVIEDLKKLIPSPRIFDEIMQLIPPDDWNQISTRNSSGLVLGYHISTGPKMCLKALEKSIFYLISDLNPGSEDFFIWFEKNKNAYLHWLGIGYTEKAGLEVTLYLRCNEKSWDSHYPPLDLVTYLNKRVFNLDK